MTPERDFIAGEWVRFGAYEVTCGLIRPYTSSGVRTYEPWREFTDSLDPESLERSADSLGLSAGSDRKRRLPDAPYQALLALVSEIEREGGEASEALVCRWCAGHGLLGLLPHQTHSAFLVPRYEWTDTGERDGLFPVQRLISWARGVWTTEIRVALDGVVEDADVSRFGGEPVPADVLPGGWTAPVAVFSQIDELRPEPVPLQDAWGRFFPEASDKGDFPYPSPSSLAFWRSYAEPLDEFLHAATLFSDAVRGIATAQHEADTSGFARHVRILETLAAGASPHLRVEDESGSGPVLSQYWVTPSLLSAYALMALFDVAGGRRLRVCADPKCRMPFRSSAYQGAYCSKRHRSRHTVERHRERKAEARRLFEAGVPVEEIVSALEPFRLGELDADTVRKWAVSGGWSSERSSF